jgi:ABC-type lipoprotein release transport system permease subunit
MVFSLLAYFLSMVTAFTVVMAALIGFGDSQLRTTRLHSPAVSIVSDRDAFGESEKAKEAQKAAEARKVLEAQRAAEAQKAAEARENARKLARAKVARERKQQAMIARLRQQREMAFGNANQYPNGAGLYSYAPFEH